VGSGGWFLGGGCVLVTGDFGHVLASLWLQRRRVNANGKYLALGCT